MKPKLSPPDRALLIILARVRALRPETAICYPAFKGTSVEAMRKRMDRLAEKGFLATSGLPSGVKLFRLSRQGTRAVGAPESWAASPSAGIAAEALSIGAVACNVQEYVFPTRAELEQLLVELVPNSKAAIPARLNMSRFVLRTIKTKDDNGETTATHLDYWLAELRPPAELFRRVSVIVQNLQSSLPGFSELSAAGLFGISIAVPTEGVRATLQASAFPIPANIVVVEELRHLIPV